MIQYQFLLQEYKHFNPDEILGFFSKHIPELYDLRIDEKVILWYYYCYKYNRGSLCVDGIIGDHFRLVMLGEME